MKLSSPYTGGGSLTREQFLFYEMRITARLLVQGMSDQEAIEKITKENLFQYPTEKSLKKMASVCLKRLHAMKDNCLIDGIANQPADTAKQICLYAMMKQNRLVWDFMIRVVGGKYKSLDTSFSRVDLNSFFMGLAEQDDLVASWSESTIKKIKQVLVRILVENEYLDNNRSNYLNPVLIGSLLEERIRSNNDNGALIAFNCLG